MLKLPTSLLSAPLWMKSCFSFFNVDTWALWKAVCLGEVKLDPLWTGGQSSGFLHLPQIETQIIQSRLLFLTEIHHFTEIEKVFFTVKLQGSFSRSCGPHEASDAGNLTLFSSRWQLEYLQQMIGNINLIISHCGLLELHCQSNVMSSGFTECQTVVSPQGEVLPFWEMCVCVAGG